MPYRKSIEVTCQRCGKKFKEKQSRIDDGRGKFCSKICFYGTSEQNFWGFVKKADGDECWAWQSCIANNGYGLFSSKGRRQSAHRYSYELHYGPIPKGMCVCHKCDNKPCVRPDHFFLGTHKDNAVDRQAKGRGNTLAGEQCPWTKISANDVIKAFEMRSEGNTHVEISAAIGVGRQMVGHILHRKRWSHVPIPERLLLKASSPYSQRPDCQQKLQPCQEIGLSQEGS